MPVVSVYHSGTSASVLSGVAPINHTRGLVQGWTQGSAARNNHFLQSIDPSVLSGEPWALTLTIPAADAGKGDLPESGEFHAMLRAMIETLRRLGALRWHWVIEMTTKKTPHIHMAVWLPATVNAAKAQLRIRGAWERITKNHGLRVSQAAQDVKRMSNAGWLQYLSKHGARGVKHYQRMREALPDSWRDHPGRMWGYGGDWPSVEERKPIRKAMGTRAFWTYRRWVAAWCRANARKTRNERLRRRYIAQARSMLRCNKRTLSEVKPISVWIPEAVTRRFLLELEAHYYDLLVEVGGDMDACEEWSVTDYKPSTVLVDHQREEWADAMHSVILTTVS